MPNRAFSGATTEPSDADNTAETIEDADAALVEKVAPSDKAAVQALSLIGEIGDQPPMRALCASIIIFGLIRRDAKLTLAGVRMLTAHTIATKAKNVLKKRVDRVRPDAREGEDDHRVKAGVSASHDETSFPSGHSAGALAVGAASITRSATLVAKNLRNFGAGSRSVSCRII